jgi:predicted nucleic acid-binding protein
VLSDTNILLRLRDVDDPQHEACITALERLAERGAVLCVCTQVFIEYWVVATRPREVNGLGVSPEDAARDLEAFTQSLLWLDEPPNIGAGWRDLAGQYAVRGRQAHDTRPVALLVSHILTLNPGDFRRYAEVACLTPEEVLQESP